MVELQGFSEVILAAFVVGGIVGAAVALHLSAKGHPPAS